jgi:hypothetical protein
MDPILDIQTCLVLTRLLPLSFLLTFLSLFSHFPSLVTTPTTRGGGGGGGGEPGAAVVRTVADI